MEKVSENKDAIVLHLGENPVVLLSEPFNSDIDVDALTRIDYTNLIGEMVTISALMNKVGNLRAEAEKCLSDDKLDCDIYEASKKKSWRNEANRDSGKFMVDGESIKLSEKALDEAILLDPLYQQKKRKIISSQRVFSILDSWFWSVNDKSKKLNNLVKPLEPNEFVKELIEGRVNSFIIKKPKI